LTIYNKKLSKCKSSLSLLARTIQKPLLRNI